MRGGQTAAVFAILSASFAAGSFAAEATPLAAAADAAVAAPLAADEVAVGAAAAALARVDAARQTSADAGAASARARRSLRPLVRRLDAAAAALSSGASAAEQVRALRLASAAARALVRKLTPRGEFTVAERRGATGFGAPGGTVTFTVKNCADVPAISVSRASASPHQRTFDPTVTDLGGGRFRAAFGPDVGALRVAVTSCAATREIVLFDEGPAGCLDVALPTPGGYPAASLRAGVAGSVARSGGGDGVTAWEAAGPLPAGLAVDAATGAVTGTPAADAHRADYRVVGRNARGSVASDVSIEVTPALPDGMVELEEGFAAERWVADLDVPVKMALAPDGRVFFNELVSGRIRVVGADGVLVEEPFATRNVAGGGERGLIGLALSPDFATDGHVYVFEVVPGDGVDPERSRIVRLTATGNEGGDAVVLVDGLPVAGSQNGGALAFGPDGALYATVGDTGDEALPQEDGARAGRVLRFTKDGGIPADNPVAGDPEWCRGLRNPFDIAFHPTTGGLFATENGPMANDELEFIQPGKNYEWGAEPESLPGPVIGLRMIDWSPVIVPTGLSFLAGTSFGEPYAASLYVAGYDAADLRRVVLSGKDFTDVDEELPFAKWDETGIANRPLDLLEAPDGSLLVSTFDAIWRIARY